MTRDKLYRKYRVTQESSSCILSLIDELVELEVQLSETPSSHIKTKRDIVSLMSEIQRILVRDYQFENEKIANLCNNKCECE